VEQENHQLFLSSGTARQTKTSQAPLRAYASNFTGIWANTLNK
jgi:hypothetical protein